MSAYAWPFVALCFVAVLWRGLDLIVRAVTVRMQNHAISIREHDKRIASVHDLFLSQAKVEGTLQVRIQNLEDNVKALDQRTPGHVGAMMGGRR